MNTSHLLFSKKAGYSDYMKKKDLIITGPKSQKKVFLFAHGAGAPMDSDWMNDVADALAREGIKTARFEFPYMAERRETGKKRPPNPQRILLETWNEVLDLFHDHEVYIGGKSMGARMASLIADQSTVKGLICLGFPFYAPGKFDPLDPKGRVAHLAKLKTKTLIFQGERDSMGDKENIPQFALSKKVKVHWLADGDHSLKPRKKSGYSLEEHIAHVAKEISKFMK
ncbi:alpha/beta hydrolase family protein [Bacteriovorax sp. DB6_IX]|nr:alpha/beta hydrolase family protein [Bacteriovorax sp. DB6_IX]